MIVSHNLSFKNGLITDKGPTRSRVNWYTWGENSPLFLSLNFTTDLLKVKNLEMKICFCFLIYYKHRWLLHLYVDNSVQFSHSVVADSLWPRGLQHTRPPCPSPTPKVYSNSCLLSWWCHSAISSSVSPFFSRIQSFPASGSFPMSQFFASSGQSIGASASASVLPVNTQDWSPLGWTGWISLQSKGLSRVFSNTTVQKHQFFGAQVSV